MKISPVGVDYFFPYGRMDGETERDTNGRTGMGKLIVDFRNFLERALKGLGRVISGFPPRYRGGLLSSATLRSEER